MNITHDIETKFAPYSGNTIELTAENFGASVIATFDGDDNSILSVDISDQIVDADDCRTIAAFFEKLALVLDGDATEEDLEG